MKRKKGRRYKGESLETGTSFGELLKIVFIVILVITLVSLFIYYVVGSIAMKILSYLIGEQATQTKDVSTSKSPMIQIVRLFPFI